METETRQRIERKDPPLQFEEAVAAAERFFRRGAEQLDQLGPHEAASLAMIVVAVERLTAYSGRERTEEVLDRLLQTVRNPANWVKIPRQ